MGTSENVRQAMKDDLGLVLAISVVRPDQDSVWLRI